MAGASAFRVGLEAMRLGGIIYIVPFFFVLNPALVGQAPASEIMIVVITALLGVWLISAAIQGYVSFVGGLGQGLIALTLRILLLIAGLFLAAPETPIIGLSHVQLSTPWPGPCRRSARLCLYRWQTTETSSYQAI